MADGDERSGTGGPMVLGGGPPPAHVVGSLVAWEQERGAMVTFPGREAPVAARSIIALDEPSVLAAIAAGRGVLLAFDGGRRESPIIIGLLQDHAPSVPLEVQVDGSRVVIAGREEIVLQCGLASITLRRNGRVIIRGIEVETRARGVNRIRGGSVQIN